MPRKQVKFKQLVIGEIVDFTQRPKAAPKSNFYRCPLCGKVGYKYCINNMDTYIHKKAYTGFSFEVLEYCIDKTDKFK